ncbi:MAG: glycoside hydrolase family 15 protein, partial [Alphaproteobacteria bacterium]|nr:glycoside hydrolase family 15 protein [Alphaproteobacteria bacterium]
ASTLVLGPDETLSEGLLAAGRDFLEQTEQYWQEWCRYLSLPFEWQPAVIRAAITLKMSSFEESGAIIAAATTSIPEAPDTGRNWDYRLCWLRDSYFTVHALNRLGVTRTMEGYLRFLINVADVSRVEDLQPVFGITQEKDFPEWQADALPGYRGMGPVRIGNDAYKQIQNDGYGHVVLASAQVFFDERLPSPGDESLFYRLEALGEKAIQKWDKPDAGLWEFRNRADVHTFSSILCWAACDRLAAIATHLGLNERAGYWERHASDIREAILERSFNREKNCIAAAFGGSDLDASLLLMGELGFLPYDDPRFIGTVEAIEKELRRGSHMFRYAAEDDFGRPETAFNVCTFWFIDALAGIGRLDEAREMFEGMLASRTKLGLLSEDLNPETHELWGNFPQTYS